MLQYHQRETFVAHRAPEKREIMDVKEILSKLTEEEKAALVAGTNFMYTNPVPRLGMPSLRMSDGPHGLRVQGENADNGVTGSDPATAFPTAATVACGWREENARKIGEAIGKEARHYGIGIVLGPGTNIKRDPRAGRNFEYYSEDPLLTGKCAAAEIEGVQSAGVGVSLKHFALNNSENYRFMGDSVADERTMRGIYGAGKTLDETFGLIETVEKAAQIYMLTAHLPRKNTIKDEDMLKLLQLFCVKNYRKDFLNLK